MRSDLGGKGDFLRRGGGSPHEAGHTSGGEPFQRAQEIPVNMYETEDLLVVVAPMPGVEADNIDIEIERSTLTLRASLRGPGQEGRRYRLHEWSYGPYVRSVQLPCEVDAERANASHDNGVLAITLPKTTSGHSVHIPLQQVAGSGSLHRGHSGRATLGQGPDNEGRR